MPGQPLPALVPLAISSPAVDPVISNVGSRNPPPSKSPLRSPLTSVPLHMLFQSNQGHRSNEDAKLDANAARFSLQRTHTAQVLVH